MSIEAVDFDETLTLEEWLKSDEAAELQNRLEERILTLLFSDDISESQFQQMVQYLARIGTDLSKSSLLEKEIIELNEPFDELITQCGFGKKAWKATCKTGRFFKKHRKEILAGVAICATGIGIAVVTGYALSASVGGVVVAGAKSIFSTEEKPNPLIPNVRPPTQQELAECQQALSKPLPQIEVPISADELLVTSKGIWVNGQFYSNEQLMHQSIVQNELSSYLSTNYGWTPVPPEHLNTFSSSSDPQQAKPQDLQHTYGTVINPSKTFEVERDVISTKFIIEGKQIPSCQIGWINGINNTYRESMMSGQYIQSLSGGLAVSGVHNCSHTPIVDLLECVLLNYNGHSPFTAKMVKEDWNAFHEANANNPHAKFLQFCHSQGAIHVKNALEQSLPEIRDRIIVVAIAPAAVVPKEFCFQSFNYVSEKDIVYKFELTDPPSFESLTVDDVILPTVAERIYSDQLIILKAHPEATGIDHAFLSPTYRESMEERLAEYQFHEGIYSAEEKGNVK